jgi:hypothetical protein
MEGKVHVVTCGIQSQLSELQHALQESMTDGYWLIIQNAHLSAPWNKDLLELLKVDRALEFLMIIQWNIDVKI